MADELYHIRGNQAGINTGLSLPSPQGLYDAWKNPAHALGTKMWFGERCFKYARTGVTITYNDRLAFTNPYQICSNAAVGTAVAGATKMTMTLGASDGVAGNGEVAENELIGAWASFLKVDGSTWSDVITVMIVGNTGGDEEEIEFTIDNPLGRAIHQDAVLDITSNLYRDVRVTNLGRTGRMFMGKPMVMATTTYPYYWLQTWGPFTSSCSSLGEAGVGDETYRQQVSVISNGSLINHYEGSTTHEYAQHIGCVITRLQNGNQATPLIYMQISC